jgi:hypothetical protein
MRRKQRGRAHCVAGDETRSQKLECRNEESGREVNSLDEAGK